MKKILFWCLIATTVLDILLTYCGLKFCREAELNPWISQLIDWLGPAITLFVVMPIYFSICFLIIYKSISVKYWFKWFWWAYFVLCIIKVFVIGMWIHFFVLYFSVILKGS